MNKHSCSVIACSLWSNNSTRSRRYLSDARVGDAEVALFGRSAARGLSVLFGLGIFGVLLQLAIGAIGAIGGGPVAVGCLIVSGC